MVYHHAAGSFLAHSYDQMLSERVPGLSHDEMVWHPSGFMVARLGLHASLGARQREERGDGLLPDEDIYDGDIHDHAWFVDGLNIAGYRDHFYELHLASYKGKSQIPLSAGEIAQRGLLRKFTARYLDGGTIELKAEMDMCHPSEDSSFYIGFKAKRTDTRELDDGDLHSIDPGQFHAPAIPDDRFAATLAFNSFRVAGNGPHIMIGGECSLYRRARQPVTAEEWEAAREQLLQHAAPAAQSA